MIIMVVNLGSVWVASLARFRVFGTSSMYIPCPFHWFKYAGLMKDYVSIMWGVVLCEIHGACEGA